jgi:hypothetical protein
MKQRRITVKELKDLEPRADAYEFKQPNFYVIVVNKPRVVLSGVSQSSIDNANNLGQLLQKHGIKCILVALDDKDEIKVLELKEGYIK